MSNCDSDQAPNFCESRKHEILQLCDFVSFDSPPDPKSGQRGFRDSLFSLLNKCVAQKGLGPQSMFLILGCIRHIDPGGPIQRFHAWLVRARRIGSGTSSTSAPPDEKEGGTQKPLPTHLLAFARQATFPKSQAARKRHMAAHNAWTVVEWLITSYNYFELGCPKSRVEYEKGLGPWKLNDLQRDLIVKLFEGLIPFFRIVSSEGWSRGRKSLHEALQLLSHSKYIVIGSEVNINNVAAQEVDPACVSMPEHAGVVDPRKFLTSEQCKTFENLESIVKPVAEWPHKLPRPCHMISRENEGKLRGKPVAAGMADLILEKDVPCDTSDRKLLAGLFCVYHKKGKLRLIIDRRPQNSIEHRLCWETLPHGSL